METATAKASISARDIQPDLFSGPPVKIEIFEGPLDLLLYLVKRSEIDIYEVRLAQITDEYLSYLRTMTVLNIELAGEFLVLAAALLLIKSRMLLPLHEAQTDEEEEEIDAEQELAQRLLEYRTFKEAAELLDESRRWRERIYLRALGPEAGLEGGYVLLEEVSVFDLVAAFRELLARAEEKPVTEVKRRRYTVADRIRYILQALAAAPEEGLTFLELLPDEITKPLVIVTFLAILELIRRRRILVRQESPRAPIRALLRRAERKPPAATTD